MPKKQVKRTPRKTTPKKTVAKTPRRARAVSKRTAKPTRSRTTRPKTISQHRGKERSMAAREKAPDTSRIIPDTSVLVEGVLSREIQKAGLEVKEIIIHEAVLAELEAQANRRKEIGYLGLDEVDRLRKLSITMKFKLSFKGTRPGHFEISYAKSGEIDQLIRQLAEEENAVLYTADVVQAKVARVRGIPVILHRNERVEPEMDITKFFDETTMSVHIKENCPVSAKRGRPGQWEFAIVQKNAVRRSDVEIWAKQIVEAASTMHDGFIEIERKGSTIAQIGKYRIVITRPPFADGFEITAVRPVKRLSLGDYKISEKLRKRIDEQAEGVLIAGAPGHGKSTFAQALAEYYESKKKVVKTVEAPRDMVLPDDITQYAISHGSSEEVHDILLLSRPDYTFFDEMRNTDDFKLFADMRLSGVGMLGVMHGTKTIDAIQRFLGRIELGVIPHVVDTVIFIKDGDINSVYAITMTVKVPSGMTEADLARPVVEVHEFESGKLMFEIYTYGEQTVVIPVKESTKANPVHRFAQEGIRKFFQKYARNPEVEVASDNKLIVRVDEDEKPALIGRGGENIQRIEQELGMSIDVQSHKGRPKNEEYAPRKVGNRQISFRIQDSKTALTLDLGPKFAHTSVDILIEGDFIMTAHASRKGKVKLTKRNKMVRMILDGLDAGTVTVVKSA